MQICIIIKPTPIRAFCLEITPRTSGRIDEIRLAAGRISLPEPIARNNRGLAAEDTEFMLQTHHVISAGVQKIRCEQILSDISIVYLKANRGRIIVMPAMIRHRNDTALHCVVGLVKNRCRLRAGKQRAGASEDVVGDQPGPFMACGIDHFQA